MEYLLILALVFLITLFIEIKYHLRLYTSRKERTLIPLIFLLLDVSGIVLRLQEAIGVSMWIIY